MSSDGPGQANLSKFDFYQMPSAGHTGAAANWVEAKHKLVALLRSDPRLQAPAAELIKSGITDPWRIIFRLDLTKSQRKRLRIDWL